MKINFLIKTKDKEVISEAIEINFKQEGYICSLIFQGNLSNPQIGLISSENIQSLLPTSRQLFVMLFSWSELVGIKYKQYSDSKVNVIYKSKTIPIVGSFENLRGTDFIRINIGTDSFTLRITTEASQADLDNLDSKDSSSYKDFLETCARLGIRIINADISNNYDLSGVKLSGGYFFNVKFINSNLEGADFNKATFDRVEFTKVCLQNAVFNYCRSRARLNAHETLTFKDCDLASSSFLNVGICCKFENSNLEYSDFTESRLTACIFQDCIIIKTNFSKAHFKPYREPAVENAIAKNRQLGTQIANSFIGPSKPEEKKGTIKNAIFKNALMSFVDISNNEIYDTSFEGSDLSNSKIQGCKLVDVDFHGDNLRAAKLNRVDLSNSEINECNFGAANMKEARIICTKISNSHFPGTIFEGANLFKSNFQNSILTGVDFRYSNLTLVTFDKCHLHSAKFYNTQRGGLDLKIKLEEIVDDGAEQRRYTSSCYVNCVDWSTEGNGEIQIDANSFFSIISGDKPPAAAMNDKASQIYISNYNQAVSKSAQKLRDNSINNAGDANNSEFQSGNITDSLETLDNDISENEQFELDDIIQSDQSNQDELGESSEFN